MSDTLNVLSCEQAKEKVKQIQMQPGVKQTLAPDSPFTRDAALLSVVFFLCVAQVLNTGVIVQQV